MLIVVSILVFYNEITNKMSLAELLLMIVALLAIIRASLNYIQLNDMITPQELKQSVSGAISNIKSNIKLNSGKEGFTNQARKPKSRGRNNSNDPLIDLMSEQSKENFESNSTSDNPNIDRNAVNKINSLFQNNNQQKHNNKSIDNTFEDIPTTTAPTTTSPTTTRSNPTANNNYRDRMAGVAGGIDSIFKPQIIIGGSDIDQQGRQGPGLFGTMPLNNLATNAASAHSTSQDGMTFPDTMKPSGNLWSSDLDKMDMSGQWTQNMDAYNHGRWNPRLYNKPSDYVDYYMPSAYGMSTPPNTTPTTNNTASTPTTLNEYGQSKKLCGGYDNLDMDQAGNLVVRDYKESKKWVPGYTYVPPVFWDVPQRHVSVCNSNGPNVRKLTGLIDRGLPLNVLELNPDGSQAQSEDEVQLTNVGSIMPRFNYQEMPFSKPYV